MVSKGNSNQEAKERFSDKFDSYSHLDKAKEWLRNNSHLVRKMFENVKLRDFIFEPFKDVFHSKEKTDNSKLLSVITQVAIANAVLAGLPGKMGIGVFVSIGLEAWMAFSIARAVGIKIDSINDIWKYFGLLVGVAGTILYLFRHLLGFAFSLFSIIPMLPSTVLAELVITDFVGILFWFGFEEAKESGSFTIPKRIITKFKGRMQDLYNYQKDFVKAMADKENIKLVYNRIKSWLSGEIVINKQAMRGEIFAFVGMAYLIQGHYDAFQGPMGEIFIDSIRRAYSRKLGEATLQEMSDFFTERTPAQLKGDVQLVKGEMFEHLIEEYENADGDEWIAKLHDDRTVPGSDIIFTNMETGEEIEISLKSTDKPYIIEKAIEKYPDIPILTTSEAEEYFGDHPFVDYSQFSDNELEKVTEDNFEALVSQLEPIESSEIVTGGVSAKALGMLWPFVIAYIRKQIKQEQLEAALVKVLGESGVSLASRLAYAIIFGPIFAWYLLARSVLLITKGAENLSNNSRVLVQSA